MWRVLLVAVLLGALLALPLPTFACTPPPGGLPRYTVADRVKAAPVVFEGTVTSISFPVKDAPYQTATVQVLRYFKGTGAPNVTVSRFGPSSVCLSEVQQGARYIFYASGAPNNFLAYYLSQFDAVTSPEPQTIAEIEATIKNLLLTPTLSPTPTLTPNPTLQRAQALTASALPFATLTLPQSTRTPLPTIVRVTPTPPSLFDGKQGVEIGILLSVGCAVGGVLGLVCGILLMAFIGSNKD